MEGVESVEGRTTTYGPLVGSRNITKTRTTYQSSCEQLSRSRRGGVAAEFSAEFRVLGYVAFKGEILARY